MAALESEHINDGTKLLDVDVNGHAHTNNNAITIANGNANGSSRDARDNKPVLKLDTLSPPNEHVIMPITPDSECFGNAKDHGQPGTISHSVPSGEDARESGDDGDSHDDDKNNENSKPNGIHSNFSANANNGNANIKSKEQDHINNNNNNNNTINPNKSSPPQIPNSDARRKSLSVPTPISIRGRVVSLDRRGYMHHSDEDDEVSSQNSSDDGSYFSEHHLSPNKSDFPLLPRRRTTSYTSGMPLTNPRNQFNHQNVPTYQRSKSIGGQPMPNFKTLDSDLSLSSSSNDEFSNAESTNNLENAYSFARANSAPETFRQKPLKPRSDIHIDVDLEPISVSGDMMEKPPMPKGKGGGPLQVISSSEEFLPRSSEYRFPSVSSLVSSSSEDVGDIGTSDHDRVNEGVEDGDEMQIGSKLRFPHLKMEENGASDSQKELMLSKERIGKHRRQMSVRSVDSSKSGIPQLQVGNVWRAEEVESELSDADSSAVVQRRRRHPRFPTSEQSASSLDARIPLIVSSSSGGVSGAGNSSSVPQTPSLIAKPLKQPLNDDQLKAWQSGLVRNESYMSSSISPERRSLQYQNHSTATLVYSEDDTDESGRHQHELLLAAAAQEGQKERNEVAAAGMGPVERRSGRSFGRDLTNSKSDPMAKHYSGDVGHSSGRSTDFQPSSNISRGSAKPITVRKGDDEHYSPHEKYKVYWQRWVMLMYMSLLNLLSDWTCYSIAPIAVLTANAFGDIDPEHLVTVFLASNALSTAMEPIILSRLGLRNTVVFGSFLLMCGSIIKSGGIPGIIGTELTEEDAHWRIYVGFLLVGLSQPLYQCTPTLLSCSWFPEKERTFATSVALNSNQLGIGFAFVFGTMLVLSSDDIPNYFGLLSTISTLVFIGCFLQFKDAPPTPPSETARVIRGTLEVKIPYMDTMRQVFPGNFKSAPFARNDYKKVNRSSLSGGSVESRNTGSSTNKSSGERRQPREGRRKSRSSERRNGSPNMAFRSQPGSSSRLSRRSSRDGKQRRSSSSSSARGLRSATAESGIRSSSASRGKSKSKRRDLRKAPSPSSGLESTENCRSQMTAIEDDANNYGSLAPSPMMNGRVGPGVGNDGYYDSTPQRDHGHYPQEHPYSQQRGYGQQDHSGSGSYQMPHPSSERHDGGFGFTPDTPFANLRHPISTPAYHLNHMQHQAPPYMPNEFASSSHSYHQPYPPDPRYMYHTAPLMPGMHPSDYHQYQQQFMHPPHHMYYPPPLPHYQYHYPRSIASSQLPATSVVDDGAEPVLSQAGSNLDIEVRDDQVLRSIRACFHRKGFTHTVVAFAASGIVLNTLSTYMDYLVRLGGSGSKMVGIVGGSFQILVMVSSIVIGKITDKTRAYFAVVIGMLVLGAFALAECGINLDAQRGDGLKWSLLLAALLIGPLQPVSTELAVDVSFPLCSNTVLVIQQLVSNLCSALFIPFFQSLRDFGKDADGFERPQYTFSFYMLIVIHAVATVFFATFNGQYMRLAHEQRNKTSMRRSRTRSGSGSTRMSKERVEASYDEERAALLH